MNLKKRYNKWSAVFKNRDGKKVVLTTKVDVIPECIPAGKTEKEVRKEQEAKAYQIGMALEECHRKGEKADDESINILIANGLVKYTGNKDSVEKFLDDFLNHQSKTKKRILIVLLVRLHSKMTQRK